MSVILPITDEIILRASDLYADLRRRGQTIGDADLIIAATALVYKLPVVTRNTTHFRHVQGLVLDCWTLP